MDLCKLTFVPLETPTTTLPDAVLVRPAVTLARMTT
jgi:hypothetical protein